MAGAQKYNSDDESGGEICDINVTPLVDICLVLLIIFMVTAKLIATGGIDVNLPKTVSGDASDTTLTVTIDKTNTIYAEYKNTRYDNIAEAVEVIPLPMRKAIRALISADETVAHGTIMEVIDALKVRDIHRLALAREPKDP